MTSTMIVIVVVVLAGMAWSYNSLVRGRVRLGEAWSQIDVQLKRRHDLIPNLVQTVQGYATHEQTTLMAVTQARVDAIQAQATSDPAQVGPAEARVPRPRSDADRCREAEHAENQDQRLNTIRLVEHDHDGEERLLVFGADRHATNSTLRCKLRRTVANQIAPPPTSSPAAAAPAIKSLGHPDMPFISSSLPGPPRPGGPRRCADASHTARRWP
jgi:LemA protein